MKKFALIIICLILNLVCFSKTTFVYAFDGETDNPFVVYTIDGEYLFEKSSVEVGDNYISKDFLMYEISSVDMNNKTAVAVFVKELKKPDVSVNPYKKKIESNADKRICLYLTHNDESYVPTDGYDSVYGAGGVHDVAKAIKTSFENLGIKVALDETLHIPHDTSAYSRSNSTAKKLLSANNPDAIFDIHRDGVSRKYYATTVNGVERSKVRIVVGQANANYEENLEFATYLLAVAEENYPWLFSDIYMAKGHYNQGLYNKALLFEMGTYLIEKELVLASVKPLTEVVSTALYATTVNSGSGEIVVGGEQTEETPTVNEHLNKLEEKNENNTVLSIVLILTTFLVVTTAIIVVVYFKILNKNDGKK